MGDRIQWQEPRPKNSKHWAKIAVELIQLWQMPDPIDGTIPLLFSDELAAMLFTATLSRTLYRAYREGIRFEEKRRKARAVKRWQKMQEGGMDE